MQIVTYANTRAPRGYQAVARIYFEGKPLPIIFEGDDAAKLRAAAQAWWDAELAKLRALAAHKGKGKPARSKLEGVVDPASL